MNSDVSARGLGKGPDRPLNDEADRACVLAALESVSLVTLFDEPTPVELLKLVRPQLYVKGGDYDIETLEETPLGAQLGRRRARAAVRRRLLDDRAGATHPPLSELTALSRRRLTSTMPSDGRQREHQPRVIGSPSSTAPTSRPNTGVSSVNDDSRVAG